MRIFKYLVATTAIIAAFALPQICRASKYVLQITAPPNFSGVTIEDSPDSGSIEQTSMHIQMGEASNSAKGWTVTASCTNLVNEFNDTIAVTNLTIVPQDIVAMQGSLTGLTKGTSHTFTSTSDAATLAQANSGGGVGLYSQDESLRLSINVATPPGTYHGTMTLTIF